MMNAPERLEHKAPAAGGNRVAEFKKMCRLLELYRRRFLENDWEHFAKIIPRQQFVHLMLVRLALPCNLSQIMKRTGLTSAGASIFVEKMVKLGIFERVDDPADRRNVVITFTPRAGEELIKLEDRLNCYIFGFFADCSAEELETLEQASRIVCKILEKNE